MVDTGGGTGSRTTSSVHHLCKGCTVIVGAQLHMEACLVIDMAPYPIPLWFFCQGKLFLYTRACADTHTHTLVDRFSRKAQQLKTLILCITVVPRGRPCVPPAHCASSPNFTPLTLVSQARSSCKERGSGELPI